MKVRKALKERTDYEAFDKLYYKTEYSYEEGRISQERTEVDPIDPPMTYGEYCENIDMGFQEYLMLENDNGEIIGSATVIDNKIDEFVIDRVHQLKGNGRVFYQLLEHRIKSMGADKVYLSCYYPGARMFWKNMGFKESGFIFIKKI